MSIPDSPLLEETHTEGDCSVKELGRRKQKEEQPNILYRRVDILGPM